MTYQCSTFRKAQEYSAGKKSSHVVQKCRSQGDDPKSNDEESQPCRPKVLEKQVGWNVRNDILEGPISVTVTEIAKPSVLTKT